MKYIPPKKINPSNRETTKVVPKINCPNCGK